jgi:hypothetical protein
MPRRLQTNLNRKQKKDLKRLKRKKKRLKLSPKKKTLRKIMKRLLILQKEEKAVYLIVLQEM